MNNQIPCKLCVVMAICNARVPNSPSINKLTKKDGIPIWSLYKSCDMLRKYIDANYKRQIDDTTFKTDLKPIRIFFDEQKQNALC